ncbi:MAG TPA: Xaa-Pro peptidase family protein [Dissulfurispiraceae bacterium]|nr:Xaa-Pro peptidase family protein [Dissulfurispiraceae bacterium]
MIPFSEIESRRVRLQSRLQEKGIDGALFVYPVDIFYFTGTRQNSALWVPVSGEPVLLVRKSFSRAKTESLIADTRPFPSSKEFPSLFSAGIKRIGFTFDVMPVQYYDYYTGLLAEREFVDISRMNRELRSVKSPWEREQLRISGKRLAGVFAEVAHVLMRGMREVDLAAELESRLKKAASEGNVRARSFGQEMIGLTTSGYRAAVQGGFDGPVTGKGISNASPYGPSLEPIQEGEPVMLDYAGIWDGYLADMSRIFVFGDLSPALKKAFAIACDIQDWLADNLRPGSLCEDLYLTAVGMAERAGLAGNFMGYSGEQVRFVGHGLGLELDEFPVLAKGFREPLQEGQAVALEPKFMFPGLGVVGIENTYLVTSSGGEKLTSLADDIVYV